VMGGRGRTPVRLSRSLSRIALAGNTRQVSVVFAQDAVGFAAASARSALAAVARLALPPVRVAALLALLSCGGGAANEAPAPASPAPPSPAGHAEAPAPAPAAAAPSEQAPAAALPTACADKNADLCTPAPGFVERLCEKPHQDVALALLAKATPFTRLYLKGRVDELAFDEEVLALRFHGQPKGGMIVGSGNGTYDVLRWDGSCALGMEAEVFTRSRPPRPRAARVKWHRVGDAMQNALIGASDSVKRAHARRGKECKGAMTGDVSAACEKADTALADAIVEYVRGGGPLPAPEPP